MSFTVRSLAPVVAAGLIGATLTLTGHRLAEQDAGAQELPPVVQAQRFELLDTNGTVRGVFGMGDSGPKLTLVDPSGQVRVSLDQTSEGTYEIQLKDASGAVRFGVGTTPREGGFVGLNLRDGTGAIRSRIFATDDGKQTGFQVQDPGPTLRSEMAVNNRDDRTGFQVWDTSGTPLWHMP